MLSKDSDPSPALGHGEAESFVISHTDTVKPSGDIGMPSVLKMLEGTLGVSSQERTHKPPSGMSRGAVESRTCELWAAPAV